MLALWILCGNLTAVKAQKDINTDLSTYPELLRERNNMMPKIEDNTATVREVRRFAMVHSLISMFDNAKTACHQVRKKNGGIGNQVKQELIRASKDATKAQHPPKEPFGTPVLRSGLTHFPLTEEINDSV